MPSTKPVQPAEVDAKTAATLGAVRKKLGFLPNFFATSAHPSPAFASYLQLSECFVGGRLAARQREQITPNVMSNRLNSVACTEIDLPVAGSLAAA